MININTNKSRLCFDNTLHAAKTIFSITGNTVKTICSISGKALKYFGQDIGVTTIGALFQSATPPANEMFGDEVMKVLYLTITKPTAGLRDYLVKVMPSFNITFSHSVHESLDPTVNYTDPLLTGLTEEFFFRYVIQSALLKEVPKLILKKISPKNVDFIDHKISKMARIILTSLLFALAHGSLAGKCSNLAPQFFTGMLYANRREQGASILKLALLHAVFDAMNFTISGGLPTKPLC